MVKYFFHSLPRNLIGIFAGSNLLWNIAAIIFTYAIVKSGLDWYYFTHTRTDILIPLFFPAVVIGGLVPILAPLFLIIFGYASKRKKNITTGWTLAQAALIGSVVSSIYKAFTGRIQPNVHDVVNNISTNFNFGFLNHGIFWGWPSSHTTIAFAMALALVQLYPKRKTVTFLSLLYALYIGLGVSFSIHWFSDFIAGAVVGTIIGMTVGKSFRTHFLEKRG